MSFAARKQEAQDRKKSKIEENTTPASEDDTATAEDVANKMNKETFPDTYDIFGDEAVAPLLSDNHFGARKTAAEAILDASLLVANFTQLRTLTSSESFKFKTPALAMVVCSLSFQLIFTVIIIVIWIREIERERKREYLIVIHELAEARHSIDAATRRAARDQLIEYMSYTKHRTSFYLDFSTLILAGLICASNLVIVGVGVEFQKV